MDDKQKTKDQLLSKIKKLEQQINPPNYSIPDSEQSNDKIDRFSRIFEDSLNEIFLFDVETYKFDQVNHAAQQNLGYTMEELKELTPLDIKPEHTAESFAALVAPLIKGEKRKIIFETVHQRKDQSLYDAEVHLQILDAGDSREFAAIILDTTERKMTEKKLLESEAKFKALVTQNEEIIYMIDKDGIFQLSEGKGLEKLGLNPGEVVGQSVYDLYKDYPEMLANMKSTFNGESVAVEHMVGDIYYKSGILRNQMHQVKSLDYLD